MEGCRDGVEEISRVDLDTVNAFIDKQEFQKLGAKTCVCVTTLVNGFEIVTHSSCVDPANYDEEIGKRIAAERATDKVFELLGFTLQWGKNGIGVLPVAGSDSPAV